MLAMLRATQVWGCVTNAVPGMRAALGLEDGAELAAVDAVEAQAPSLVLAAEAADWQPLSTPRKFSWAIVSQSTTRRAARGFL